jgi:hypothetical protein
MTEVAIVLAVAAGVLAVGIRIGMLVAPMITRWMERADEERDDD